MNEEINIILETTSEAMQEALQHLDKALANIRAGKASPQMVSSVMVDYYGGSGLAHHHYTALGKENDSAYWESYPNS